VTNDSQDNTELKQIVINDGDFNISKT